MPRDPRDRVTIQFQLNRRRHDEREMLELITALKQQNRFKQTVLHALRLILSLEQGDTEVLDTLFPDLRRSMEHAIERDYHQTLREEQQHIREEIRQEMQHNGEQLNQLMNQFVQAVQTMANPNALPANTQTNPQEDARALLEILQAPDTEMRDTEDFLASLLQG